MVAPVARIAVKHKGPGEDLIATIERSGDTSERVLDVGKAASQVKGH